MSRRYWRGPAAELVPLVAYLGGAARISLEHGSAEPTAPTIAASATTENATSADVHTVNVPAVTEGDLQLLIVNGAASAAYAITDPAGWAQLYDAASGNLRGALFYREAPATAAATTMSVTLSAGQRLSAIALSVQGYDLESLLENVLAASTVATGNSLTPDPNAVTMPWGADVPSLVLAIAHSAAGDEAEYPAGYAGGLTAYTGVSNNFHARTSVASREVSAASENPGAFSVDSSSGRFWASWAVAIKGGIPA